MLVLDTRKPREIDGIPCKLACQTYAKGTDTDAILAGTVEPETKLWTSDGNNVGTHKWCEGHCGAEHDNQVYWVQEGVEHGHGWACSKCHLLTQTG